MTYGDSSYGDKSYASQGSGEIVVQESATITQFSSATTPSADTSLASSGASLQQQTGITTSTNETSIVGGGASISIGQAQTLLPVDAFTTSESSVIRAAATGADIQLADSDEFSQKVESSIVTSSGAVSSPSSVVNRATDNSTQLNTNSAIIDTDTSTISLDSSQSILSGTFTTSSTDTTKITDSANLTRVETDIFSVADSTTSVDISDITSATFGTLLSENNTSVSDFPLIISRNSATALSETQTRSIEAASPNISDWFDESWSHRNKIIIDSSNVDGELTDWPLLFKTIDTDLAESAQSSGDDIVFADSTGTQLSHEIESYDSSTGKLWAHVKLPEVSASSDTELYIYYGNSNAENQENVSDVWSNGYERVYHLSENVSGTGNIGSYSDSSPNNSPADDYVSASRNDSKINSGQALDGTDDFIEIPPSPETSNFTDFYASMWFRAKEDNGPDVVIFGTAPEYEIVYDGTGERTNENSVW